jgi:hypothetical protein
VLRDDFTAEAWTSLAAMFAAAHAVVGQADGELDLDETEVIFSVVEGEFELPTKVFEALDADPALAREVLGDTGAIVRAIAPSDHGQAAVQARAHLAVWVELAATPDERERRTQMSRGLLIAVMYLGLRTAGADGSIAASELRSWGDVGDAFGLPDEWLELIQEVSG